MLNGNIGVMKSMMAELTDETNMARGFSLVAVTWAIGGTIGFSRSFFFFALWLIPAPLGHSLVVCCHGHTIIGPVFSRILFGENTHTSYHASRPLHIPSYHFLWPQFS